MRKQSAKHKTANGNQGEAIFRAIPLKEIASPTINVRRSSTQKGLTELAGSIRQHGVLQPILVCEIKPAKAGQAKYRIIAGARRYRAATEAGLKEIPALVKMMSEEEALSAQIVENLQREDVHPLDEADGFLRLKEEMKLDLRAIAQRGGKDVRYVARRLALTNLIAEAWEDFRKERITLAHALELCRLAPEIQTEALDACYESQLVFNEEDQASHSVPDKQRPAQHVHYLVEWIERHVHLNLQQAPFKLDDSRLREDGLACVNCPERTGHNKTLFADIRNNDTCLNPPCFQAKLQQFLKLRKTELEAKSGGKPVAFISAHYGSHSGNDIIGRGEYQILDRKADRCEFAEQAIYANGSEIGQVKWICREQTCKDHLGRAPESHSYSSGSLSPTARPQDHRQRKQELFDLKVDEAVRKRVMQEAIKTFAWPLDRLHLNEAVKEFFRRIPSDDQKTICEVWGWNDEEAKRLRFDSEAVLAELAKLDDHQLGQFLILCSFAHYGANPQRHRQVDQSSVVKLSQEREINHALIDAQVRAELCPKKYRAAHDEYLAAVKNGQAANKPLVCERLPQVASSSANETTASKAA